LFSEARGDFDLVGVRWERFGGIVETVIVVEVFVVVELEASFDSGLDSLECREEGSLVGAVNCFTSDWITCTVSFTSLQNSTK
jgi:hypothetical protein